MISRLWSSEEKYRATFDHAAIGIAHVSADGRFINVNNKLCEILGYTEDELLHKTFQEITHPDFLNEDLSLLKDLFEGKIEHYTMEKKYIDREGKEVWAELTVTMVRKINGDLDYYISVISEITLRKVMEQQISMMMENLEKLVEEKVRQNKTLEKEFSEFFNISSNFMIVGDATGRIRRVNQAMVDLLGYSVQELMIMNIKDLIHPEDQSKSDEFREHMNQVGGSARFFENRFITKSGEIKHISWNITVIKETGIRYAIGQDVTEQKNLQKLMEEKKIKMASLSRMNAVGRMAANIAHEINNPLTVIFGKSTWLKMQAGGKETIETEKVIEVCEEIEMMSKRITSIIRGLRSFSREETGATMQPVNIRKIIDSTLDLCRHQFKLHQVACIVEGNFLDTEVLCREIQISQVLLNLLNNAFDAVQCEKNKEIKIIVSKSDSEVTIRVIDNGGGIQNHHVPNLFEPFFTTKDMGKGTGLGLNISRQIIADHKGKIFYELMNGQTSFVIQLPLRAFLPRADIGPSV